MKIFIFILFLFSLPLLPRQNSINNNQDSSHIDAINPSQSQTHESGTIPGSVNAPLFLSAYCYGSLIDFQVEQYIAGKNFGAEIDRMFSAGRLVPRLWMKNAVGKEISLDPLLAAADEALKVVKE